MNFDHIFCTRSSSRTKINLNWVLSQEDRTQFPLAFVRFLPSPLHSKGEVDLTVMIAGRDLLQTFPFTQRRNRWGFFFGGGGGGCGLAPETRCSFCFCLLCFAMSGFTPLLSVTIAITTRVPSHPYITRGPEGVTLVAWSKEHTQHRPDLLPLHSLHMNTTEKNVFFPKTTCTEFSNPKSSQPHLLPKIKIKINQSRQKILTSFITCILTSQHNPKPHARQSLNPKNQKSELKTNEWHQNPQNALTGRMGTVKTKPPPKSNPCCSCLFSSCFFKPTIPQRQLTKNIELASRIHRSHKRHPTVGYGATEWSCEWVSG